jgi:hypothetical protein
LQDILDTHIVIGRVWDGKNTYFRTKNGTGIRVTNPSDESNMMVEGSYQMNEGQPLRVSRVYDQRKEVAGGNGKSYVLDGQPIMGTRRTVYDQLAAHPKYFSKFLELLQGSGLLDEKTHDIGTGNPDDNKATGGINLSLFNTYHYTIYVPSNEAIQQLQNEKLLPTEAELDREGYDAKTGADPKLDSICLAEKWYDEAEKETVKQDIRSKVASALNTIVTDFIRYHVQDHSVAIGMAPDLDDEGNVMTNTKYESMKRDLETGRFYPLDINFSNTSMTVKDVVGNTAHVKTDGGLYNLICREYWFEGTGDNARLFMASDAVVHQIDAALCSGYTYPADYDKDPSKAGKTVKMRPWREIVEEAINK